MTVTLTPDHASGKQLVEVLAERFGREDAAEVDRLVCSLVADGRNQIVVDLDGAPLSDEVALSVLLSSARRVKAVGGTFCVVSSHSGTADALHTSSLDKVLTVHALRADVL